MAGDARVFWFFLTSCWSLSHVLHQSFWHLSKMFLLLFVCIVVTPVYEITPSAPSSLLALIRHTVRDDGHRSPLECNVCASICVLPSVMGVLYWIWDSPSHSLKFTPSGSCSVVVYWLLPPSEPHVTSTDCPAQPAPAESESALMLPMRSSPGRTPKLQNKYHLSAYFLQQKQTSYQGVVFDFAIIVAKKKSHVESRWGIIMEAFSHCRAVSILLAAPVNFVYIACLGWCTAGSVWAACCLCARTSQSSLFGMAAHQCSGVWEETSEEGANRTVSCQFCGQMRDWISVWERWWRRTGVADNDGVTQKTTGPDGGKWDSTFVAIVWGAKPFFFSTW